MSWRRKALTLSFVFGAGVLSLGPVLSDSISKRIATSWNVQASVSKVEISLPQSSLSLFGLDLRSPDLVVYGDEVHLKMNSESLWYRDSIVESMVGKGFLFKATPLIESAAASQSSTLSPIAKVQSSYKSFESSCKAFEATIRAELDLALKQFHDFELQSHARTQTIDSRIAQLRSELSALRDPAQTPNPLRVSQRLEQLRSEGSRIQQLLAEDRLQRRQEAKTYDATVARLQESILSFRTTHPIPKIDTPPLIEELLRQSVNHARRQLQPYTTLLQFSAASLLDNPSSAITSEPVQSHRVDQDLAARNLRPRQSKILRGQISGMMEYEGGREPTVIRVSNPPAGSISDRARVQIEWGGQNNEGSNTEESAAKTHAMVERMKPDTSSVAIHLSVERQSDDEQISFQSSWDATKAISKIQLPSRFVERQVSSLGLGESANTIQPTGIPRIEATLSREFQNTAEINDQATMNIAGLNQTQWELRSDQVDALTAWFEQLWSQNILQLMEKTETQTKSVVSQESENLQRRSLRVDEVMTQRQSEWNQQLQDLIAQVAEFEGLQLRARSNASTITR